MRKAACLTLATLVLALSGHTVRAADPADGPQVQLNADNVGPRELEDLTRQSLARDYARAWATMAQALDHNRLDTLGNDFVGFALDNLAERVASQQKNGLHTHIVDHGHKATVVFYSPEGSSVQLRDTAQLEIQVLQGSTVVHSENLTLHYISVMTPTEVRWKVRVLEAVPET